MSQILFPDFYLYMNSIYNVGNNIPHRWRAFQNLYKCTYHVFDKCIHEICKFNLRKGLCSIFKYYSPVWQPSMPKCWTEFKERLNFSSHQQQTSVKAYNFKICSSQLILSFSPDKKAVFRREGILDDVDKKATLTHLWTMLASKQYRIEIRSLYTTMLLRYSPLRRWRWLAAAPPGLAPPRYQWLCECMYLPSHRIDSRLWTT